MTTARATPLSGDARRAEFLELTELTQRAILEVRRVIVGQEHLVDQVLVALLARGHCLIEGVPGVAKTLAVRTVHQA